MPLVITRLIFAYVNSILLHTFFSFSLKLLRISKCLCISCKDISQLLQMHKVSHICVQSVALISLIVNLCSVAINFRNTISSKHAHQTYEQQWPNFDNIQTILYNKFSSTSNVTCRYSLLTNPIESTIRDYLYDAAYDLTSVNVLLHGGAMLGKTCAVRKMLDALKKADPTNFHFYYYLYDDFSSFVSDLCYPYGNGSHGTEALQLALSSYNALRLANNSTTNALIVIDLSSHHILDLHSLQSLAKATLDREYQVRFVFITSNIIATKMMHYTTKRIHLQESSDMFAKQYLRRVAGIRNHQQIDEIVMFTGSNLKYLKAVEKLWRHCCSARDGTTEDIQSKYCYISNVKP